MSNTKSCILAFDMGGTFIKYACLLTDGTIIDGVKKSPSNSSGSKEYILDSWVTAIRGALDSATKQKLEVKGVGISIPGPFAFEEGKSLMKHKYQAIYEVDLRYEIKQRINLLNNVPIYFLHDVIAFLKGESLAGAAKGYSSVSAVTLGTGLGFASLVDGNILTNGRGTPHLSLFSMPYKDGILEDIVSQRGILKLFRKYSEAPVADDITVKDIDILAQGGNKAALKTFEEMGAVLGDSIQWILRCTYAECLVFGGQISKGFPLFSGALKEHLNNVPTLKDICLAKNLDDAALFGILREWFDKYEGNA